MKALIGYYGTVLSIGAAAVHYGSYGYVKASTAVVHSFTATQQAIVEDLAKGFGYEKPKPAMSEMGRREIVVHESLKRKLNPSLALALLEVESTDNQFAVSPVGAIGLMQIMPSNVKRCGLKHHGQLYDEATNIRCGLQILSEELETWKDTVKALYAYNGGAKAVKQIALCGTENTKCLGGYTESVKHARKVVNVMARDIG